MDPTIVTLIPADYINAALNGAALFMLRAAVKSLREIMDKLTEIRKAAAESSE